MGLRSFAAHLDGRRNEFIGLLVLTIAVLLGLSLVSFNPDDPSFNISTNQRFASEPTNFVGPVGSYFADSMFQLLGYSAFLFPIFLGIYASQWLFSRQVPNLWARFTGMVLMILTLSTSLAFWTSFRIGGHMPAGGVFGKIMADALSSTMGAAGSFVLLLTMFLVSLFFSTTFSFEWALGALRRVEFISGFAQRYAERRADREREAAERKTAERKSPKHQTMVAAPEPPAVTRKPKPVTPPPTPIAAKTPIPAPSKRDSNAVGDFPPTALLHEPPPQVRVDEDELRQRARMLEQKTGEFDVAGVVQHIHPGPVVTTFEFKPEAGVKYSRITGLGDDLCLALEAESVRIDRIPGKSTVGIEVPNNERATITLREILEAPEYQQHTGKLLLGLGKDIRGKIIVSDLQKMPHLLMAGSTGTGKSVSVNAMILSLLYRARPDQVKLILIDPKRLELGLYQDIPHLLVPVVTEPKVAQNALRWAVMEMESRYKKLAKRGVRNLEVYNEQIKQLPIPGLGTPMEEEDDREPLPYVVIVIDELADLMMTSPREVEESITRLAQMARAVGIHLILATQRPSVDVITGLIKANFPARISFRVASKVDSRTILDSNGAEQLLGRGDMLFLPPGSSRLMRVHGPLITEDEVSKVVDFLKLQGKPIYNQKILEAPAEEREDVAASNGEMDALYEDAVKLVVDMGKASTSALQRRLRIGYGRAASILDAMEREGIIGPPDGSKPREVLYNTKDEDGI